MKKKKNLLFLQDGKAEVTVKPFLQVCPLASTTRALCLIGANGKHEVSLATLLTNQDA